jgi:hypothetical protein
MQWIGFCVSKATTRAEFCVDGFALKICCCPSAARSVRETYTVAAGAWRRSRPARRELQRMPLPTDSCQDAAR